MRKLLLILSLLPVIALANPPRHGDAYFGDMGPPRHHRHADGEEGVPRFLHKIDLTEKQQTETKALVKAHHAETNTKHEDAKKIGTQIHRLSFSNDYSDDKVQVLFDEAAVIHREMALQKSRLDNAIFKLLTSEQQQKLQSKMENFEH